MMRKILGIMLILCFGFGVFLSIDVKAESDYVYDQADLLTIDEEVKLQEHAEFYKNRWDMNFLVVTTADADGKSAREYADDFYDARFMEDTEEDGILYLIDMDHSEIYLSASGIAIRYLTDSRIEHILDEAYECVEAGDYYGTFAAFFEETHSYLEMGIPKDQYNYDIETDEMDVYYELYEEPATISVTELLIALAAGLIAAGGTIGFVTAKYQLKFEDFHYDAYTDSDIQLSVKSDRLVNKFVTHRRIPKNNTSSVRSGGGGSMSSVHRSSGGRSHGGGGRKF